MDYKSKKRKTTSIARRGPSRVERQSFLIVCEGKKTEPIYFRSFRVSVKVTIEEAAGNTLSLVNKASQISSQGEYDQVWCVFDRDSFPPANFDNAIHAALARGFKVAYSNESFELWYLLHFHYYSSSMARTQFAPLLTKHLGINYAKNDNSVADIISPHISTAIANAERLEGIHSSSGLPPSQQNPSTTVHHLVKELLKHAAP